MMISDKAGKYLVELAKDSIKHYLETGEKLDKGEGYPIELDEKLGVFVTLNKRNNLRGCIGYAEPIKSAIEATIDVAIAAATADVNINDAITLIEAAGYMANPDPEVYPANAQNN